jgi:hypothetical protein
MLESKKKMAQSFSDLTVAMEKGKGNPKDFFSVFEQGCREFAQETLKVPREDLGTFLDLVRRMGQKIGTQDEPAFFELMDKMKGMKKTCHEKYK